MILEIQGIDARQTTNSYDEPVAVLLNDMPRQSSTSEVDRDGGGKERGGAL